MSGFIAINVEPEDNVEEDVDDTREIQLEEAFKFYQNAIKLHSQGPQHYEEAQEAYNELLQSEVFKYPEVASEFAHDELDDESTAAVVHTDNVALPVLPSSAAESSANSIPQLIHLAFKNKGQFLLDAARHQIANQTASRTDLYRFYARPAKESLQQFAQALERDDTDLDLWKKSARVADVLASVRIARFCMESVLAGEDEDGQQTIDISGLDEAYAAGELEDIVSVLQDDMSQLQSNGPRVKDKLLAILRKSNDPYPSLPKRTKTLEYLDDSFRPLSFAVPHEDLKPASCDLFSLGQKIVETIDKIHSGYRSLSMATTVKVVLPESHLMGGNVEMAAKTRQTETEAHARENGQIGILHDHTASPTEDRSRAETLIESNTTRGESGAPPKLSTQQDGEKMDLSGDGDTIEVRSAVRAQDDLTSVTSRKRSSIVAGNEEPEGRTKSKRLRARESMADLATHDEETAHEHPQYIVEQLAFYEQNDQATLDAVNHLLSKLGLRLYLTVENAKQAFWMPMKETDSEGETDMSKQDLQLLADLRQALMNWTDDNAQAVIHGHSSQDFPEKATGISQFLQRSKVATPKKARQPEETGMAPLRSLVSLINAGPTNIYDAAIWWLYSIFTSRKVNDRVLPSPYMLALWPTEMKYVAGRLASGIEDHLLQFMKQRFSTLGEASQGQQKGRTREVQSAFEFVESLFEIFLDMTSAVSDGASDPAIEVINVDRLRRWANLASHFMQIYVLSSTQGMSDPLILRFVWTSVTQARLDDDVDKAHIILLLEELKAFMEESEAEPILLPNNTVIPEISVPAIEHQLSVLSTSDFFARVFDDDNRDPMAVVEMLEPMLDSITQTQDKSSSSTSTPIVHSAQVEELVKLLESNSAPLTIALWRRLQNAYTSISYPPKVVSCLFRIIETIVTELYAPRHFDLDATTRQVELLKWLHDIDEVMIRLLSRIPDEPSSFECFDEFHIRSSMRALVRVLKLIYGFMTYEDSIRVGQTIGPQLKGASSTKQYERSKDRLREMLVRAWHLQYLLLKEATEQDPTFYPRAVHDLAGYLCRVHDCLGKRQYCKYVNKSFVKLVKKELSALSIEQDYAAEAGQVFFDLYQLRFANGVGDVDHGCPPENLDRKTAWTLVPTIMKYAERFNIKDLNKSELKGTIDKMQQALGVIKSSPALQQNRLIIRDYLKGIVKASDLFDCIKGLLALPTGPVKADTEIAASSGWYFLLGHLALAKYKSVKRVTPTSTEELDQAMTLFRQDLHHDSEKWETWYRLAQCFEAKIEDDLIWNSAKLNESRGDIALLERQAIHCYMMATAISFRTVDQRPDTNAKIEDMLGKFGTRLYASSRPPLDMEAFRTDKHVRQLSSTEDQTMSKQPYHQPIRQFTLWCFAVRLFNIRLTDRPKAWASHYARAKCLWKILRSEENHGRVSTEQVVRAITEAIEAVPKKEKSNEPILEPHLKLVSVVHKMLSRKLISHAQAYDYMQATRYARGINLSQDEDGVDWERYMIDILKKLSHADKANWHHRITNRAAHVLYDDSPNLAGALGAKHEFTQQIFTKTLTMQVWKPENERPGRHYVYTRRYVLFFIQVLEQLNDRGSLDQLVRRIRRKTTDFLDHTKIWEVAATTYVRLLRRHGKIPEGRERALFDGMNHEEFTKKSEAMELWSHDPDVSSVYLDIMREGIDLKRLNNSLMKGPVIDDLIGDAYGCLYEEYIKQLPVEEQPGPQPAPLPQGTFINMTTETAPGESEEAQRARLNDARRAQGDVAAEGPLSLSISAPVGLGLQNTPTPVPTAPGQPELEVPRERAKPGRVKTVTRREIQRKAESAIVKPPPIKTPILSKRLTVEIPPKVEEGGSPSRPSSRRGSDSAGGDADAEDSELSELDDEGQQPMQAEFEGAQRQSADREDADSNDDDIDDEGEEDAGDNGEGDGEDEEMQDAEDLVEIQDSQEQA